MKKIERRDMKNENKIQRLQIINFKLCRPNFYLNILIDSENSAK